MSWTNSYQPPPEPEALPEFELYGPDPFDINFVFPLDLTSLETERVKLVPFIPRVHAHELWPQVLATPDLLRYYTSSWPTTTAFLTHHERFFRRRPENTLFAILDKTAGGEGALAGTIALRHASPAQLSAEIAFVIVLPRFQRTHVARGATGVLARYCLELALRGLGLRRVEWCAHARNAASIALARRLGMRVERTTRWACVMPEERMQDGERTRAGDRWPERPGRHTVVLSMCWDDWEGGAREVVQENIDRKVHLAASV